MARTIRSDRLLFGAVMVLVCVGLLMVYSASTSAAEAKGYTQTHFLFRQIVWCAAGLPLLFIGMRIDYHHYRSQAVIWTLVGVTAAALIAVFFFPPVAATQRWLSFARFSLQPSELAKAVAVLFAAAILERNMHKVNDPQTTLLPVFGLALGFGALIVAEPDFGSAAVLVLAVTAVTFAAGLSYRYLFALGATLAPIAGYLILTEGYRLQRLLTFLDPWKDQFGAGFQITQSLIAVGSGGLVGLGYMESVQKLQYIPEPHTDFIYAILSEEFGLVGSTFVLLCFLVIAWRGLRASLLAPDRFGALLALGLTLLVSAQALVNISVVLSLMPTKGIPLPFVSHGGSSLAVNLLMVGVLLNISRQASATAAAPAGWRGAPAVTGA